jgi:hypothetical protein
MRGCDDGNATRHCLHDRHSESLEPGRVDERCRATHQPWHLRICDEPELQDPGVVEQRLVAPTGGARNGQRQLPTQRPPCLDQRLEILARLERGEAEHVRPAELGTLPVRRVSGSDSRRCDADPLGRHVQVLLHVAAGVGRVDEHEIAFCGARELVAVHRTCARRHPLGVQQRHEIVHHRRPDAAALGRHHPVAEVEHVDGADETLDRRPAEAAPAHPEGVRPRQHERTGVDRNVRERLADQPAASRACRGECDQLVLAGRDLCQTGERAMNVVADPGPRVGERADVERDPHGR